MAKMTKEQKKLAAQAEQRSKAAAEFRLWQRQQRDLKVVRLDQAWELAGGGGAAAGQRRLALACYEALASYQQALESYTKELDWLRQSLERAERELAERTPNTSRPIQSRGPDTDIAHAQMVAARQAASVLCRAADIYCPELYSRRFNAERERLLGVDVEQVGGEWFVYEGDGSYPKEITGHRDDGRAAFDSEEMAWYAASLLRTRL